MEEEGEAMKNTSPLLDKEKLDRSLSSLITPNLVISIFVVYCAAFAAGTSIGFSSPTQSGIMHDIGLSSAQYSVFVTTTLVGSICGSAWSGKLADLIGRRKAIGLPGLLCVVGWLSVAFSKDVLWLDVGRFLVGCGAGLSSYGLVFYISEVTPKNIRGTIMSSATVVIACGKALSFVVGPLIHWRTLALIGVIPFILQLLLLLSCTESPRWLVKTGRVQESENALRRLRGSKADISQETLEIKEFTEYCTRTSEDGFLSLFQRKYARCLIIICLLTSIVLTCQNMDKIGIGMVVFAQLSGISAITIYTSSIIHFAGFSSTIGSMTVGIVEILAASLALSVIDKLGRRPLLLISTAGCCLGTGLIALSFLLQGLQLGERVTPGVALAGLLAIGKTNIFSEKYGKVYFGSFCSGLESIPVIIVSEIFPVNIKGVGGSIVNVVSVICGCIVSYSYNSMFEWSSAGIFMIYAVVPGIGILFIWKMVPETKGLSLEEIQANIIDEQERITC